MCLAEGYFDPIAQVRLGAQMKVVCAQVHLGARLKATLNPVLKYIY
jgi:hypothetical protein